MPNVTLDNSATIADVVETLKEPEEYVRQVLGNMYNYKSERGKSLVRIGITGRGIVPHYRLQHVGGLVFLLSPGGQTESETKAQWEAHYRAFHGTSHKILHWNADQLTEQNWSCQEMSIDSVRALLGKLRDRGCR